MKAAVYVRCGAGWVDNRRFLTLIDGEGSHKYAEPMTKAQSRTTCKRLDRMGLAGHVVTAAEMEQQ